MKLLLSVNNILKGEKKNMANTKKFLDQSGVSTLWKQIASNIASSIAEEKLRAEAAEKAALDAAQAAQKDIDALGEYVGIIPETYTESSIVAYIQKVAAETLTAASGNSSETAASVKDQLDKYKADNDAAVGAIGANVTTIMDDYLTSIDKEELAGNIATNAGEIARIDAALKLAVENDVEGMDSIKELASWVNAHGTEAAGYSAAISALEALVGDTAVATQIANAIAAENLAQYAKTADIEATLQKVDTQGTVTEAINAAINALAIGDYAKAADLTALAARVTALETAGYQTSAQVTASIEAAIAALKLSETYDAKGAAAQALTDAKAYSNTNLADAKSYSDTNLATAKSYSDANLVAAKSYSDANLVTAKSYTDEAYNAIQSLTTAEIEAAIASANAQA
jgi:hypothetical protein